MLNILDGQTKENGFEAMRIFSDALAGLHVQELDLSDNALGLPGVEACSSVFGPHLQALSMCTNDLSGDAMEKVRVRAYNRAGEERNTTC